VKNSNMDLRDSIILSAIKAILSCSRVPMYFSIELVKNITDIKYR
jgi:hypothetical protein